MRILISQGSFSRKSQFHKIHEMRLRPNSRFLIFGRGRIFFWNRLECGRGQKTGFGWTYNPKSPFSGLGKAPLTTSQKRRTKHLGVCRSLKVLLLFLLIAQFNNNKRPPHYTSTTHNNNQNEPPLPYLPSAALPSHSIGMSAAPPTHGAAAPYGPTQGARDRVWPRHGQFPCWGGKMKTAKNIEGIVVWP
jgi:hypothetical protein